MIAGGKTTLVPRKGEYTFNKGKHRSLLKRIADGDIPMFGLWKPTKIYGQGRGTTTLVGFGLYIRGNKSDGIVEIENLTIKLENE